MKAYFQRPQDEEFRDSYAKQGLQPSVGGMMTYRNVKSERESERDPNRLKKVGSTVKTTGRTAQAAGAGLKATGTALRAGGAVTTRAGAALSSTGVGAIIGVPLVAIGATLSATGTASRIAGQVSSQSGKQAVRAGKGIKRVGTLRESLTKARSTMDAKKALTKALPGGAKILALRASITNFSWASWVWAAAQVPFALFALLAFGFAAGWESLSNGSGFIGAIIGAVTSALDAVVSLLTGYSFDDLTSVFIVINSVVWLIGLGTMLGMGFVYMFSGVHCVFGKGAGIKIGCIILALVGYFIPLLNIFPWAIFWAIAVIMNPE